MKKLLIIENDFELSQERQRLVFDFLETYEGKILDFSRFGSKTKEEIYNAVMNCTDIITQTCFVNGSDIQFEQMVMLLSKITDSKNVYIGYIAGDLFQYIDDNLTDEQLAAIHHHKIFEIGYFDEGFGIKPIDFSLRVNAYISALAKEKEYRDTGNNRLTGRKIKILACNGCGKAFQNLNIGSIVDELDMSEQEPNNKRGVWIWGNGEPIKLVNDCGLKEYELTGNISLNDLWSELIKSTDFSNVELNLLERQRLISVIEDISISEMEVANFLCEETKIEKRGNRQKIYSLLLQYRNSTKLSHA